MRLKANLSLLGFLLAMGGGSAASAAIVTYDFTGVVTQSTSLLLNSPLGSGFTGQVSYDTNAAFTPIFGSPGNYSFGRFDDGLVNFSTAFSGVSGAYSGSGGGILIQDGDHPPFGDLVAFEVSGANSLSYVGDSGLVSLLSMSFGLSDTSASVFSNTMLPASINLASFNAHLVTLNFSGGATLSGEVTSLTLAGAVPEPAAWAVMISGFGLTGVALRRRRTVTAA